MSKRSPSILKVQLSRPYSGRHRAYVQPGVPGIDEQQATEQVPAVHDDILPAAADTVAWQQFAGCTAWLLASYAGAEHCASARQPQLLQVDVHVVPHRLQRAHPASSRQRRTSPVTVAVISLPTLAAVLGSKSHRRVEDQLLHVTNDCLQFAQLHRRSLQLLQRLRLLQQSCPYSSLRWEWMFNLADIINFVGFVFVNLVHPWNKTHIILSDISFHFVITYLLCYIVNALASVVGHYKNMHESFQWSQKP